MLRSYRSLSSFLSPIPSSAAFSAMIQIHRYTSTIPTPPADRARHEIRKMGSAAAEPVGQSGCRYRIERVLQEKGCPPRRVYLATAGNQKYILKDVSQPNFKYLQDMYRGLGSCPYIRLLQDTVPEQSMFVYRYLTDDLLSLAKKNLPIALTKRILKDALHGLAALHDQNIVHTDVKANNILVEWREEPYGVIIEQVQLTDIEDAAYVPPGYDIVGKQVGNRMWCSPEAHTQARVNKPSDMFSFGIVCICAVLNRVIFAVDEKDLAEGEEPLSVVLERQISYFADEDGLNGLLKYIGDSPWGEVLKVIRDGFNKTTPRKPFSLWRSIDADFKNLVIELTNFDPAKRLTAHEALAHKWFENI